MGMIVTVCFATKTDNLARYEYEFCPPLPAVGDSVGFIGNDGRAYSQRVVQVKQDYHPNGVVIVIEVRKELSR